MAAVLDTGRFTVTALGGVGEYGRNCFLYRSAWGCMLLDCGVKRDLAADISAIYPELTPEIARELRMVFLSHAHEDHSAGLPYLYALGYKGKVYSSAGTALAAQRMMRKWQAYSQANGLPLPYTQADLEAVQFEALPCGRSTVAGLELLTGRTGHTEDSRWLCFKQRGEREWGFFYSGDFCLDARTLVYDLPPNCPSAVIDCAYAGKTIIQSRQYAKITAFAREIVDRDKAHLVLPVPPQGRGFDILLHCCETLNDLPIYVDAVLAENCERLGFGGLLDGIRRMHTEADIAEATAAERGIYLAADGMLSTPRSEKIIRPFLGEEKSGVMLTGHTAIGTLGNRIFDTTWREANGVRLRVCRNTIKVHLDETDAELLCRKLGVTQVMFFHANGVRNQLAYAFGNG